MPPSPLEEAIHVMLRNRDYEGALVKLMQAYGTVLFRYCIEMLRDAELAADVHQTVFEQTFHELQRSGARSSFKALLYSIARHRCLDTEKGRRRWWKIVRTEDTLPDVAAMTPPLEEHLDNGRLQRALHDCLAQLPFHARDAVNLRYREEFSYDEIAAICGDSAGTLRVRVARALPLLRQCLEKKGVSP
jgi:RNA polymerase sigma-70 factor (ECF subfamily)